MTLLDPRKEIADTALEQLRKDAFPPVPSSQPSSKEPTMRETPTDELIAWLRGPHLEIHPNFAATAERLELAEKIIATHAEGSDIRSAYLDVYSPALPK